MHWAAEGAGVMPRVARVSHDWYRHQCTPERLLMKQLPRISLLPDSVLFFFFFIFFQLSPPSIMRERRRHDDNPEDLSEEFSMCRRQGFRFPGRKVLCISQRKPAAVFTLALPLSCSLYKGDVKTRLEMETIASVWLRVIVLKEIIVTVDIKIRLTPKSIIKTKIR